MKNNVKIKHFEINEILSKLNFFRNREKKWHIVIYYKISIFFIEKILHAEKFHYIKILNCSLLEENNSELIKY